MKSIDDRGVFKYFQYIDFLLLYSSFFSGSGAISLSVCVLVVDLPLKLNLVNAVANLLQLILMYFAYSLTRCLENKKTKGIDYSISHRIYEFILVVISLAYILYCFFSLPINNYVVYICAAIIFVCTIIMTKIKQLLKF